MDESVQAPAPPEIASRAASAWASGSATFSTVTSTVVVLSVSSVTSMDAGVTWACARGIGTLRKAATVAARSSSTRALSRSTRSPEGESSTITSGFDHCGRRVQGLVLQSL